MDGTAEKEPVTRTALEDFLRDYVETIGGAWDEVEPQVYDLLLPAEDVVEQEAADPVVARVTFDPEALPEHPCAQLASFGTPFVNRLLAHAVGRGRTAELYLVGLNLVPHDLASRIRRTFTMPADLTFAVERARPLFFPQAVYWFEAEFTSDQKEQEIVPVALDLHYGRQVRHLEPLLDHARLSETPGQALPEVHRLSIAAGYPLARERALRTFATLANTRGRELKERLDRQVGRMARYYADLRNEAAELESRARSRSDDPTRLASRREAVEREERLRIAELRQKNTLHVQVRLLNVLVVQQPKLALHGQLSGERVSGQVQLVWDPLMETLEAVPCPMCARPTFELALTRSGQVVCSACAAGAWREKNFGQGTRQNKSAVFPRK
jgi:hypothetical protein